MALKLATAQKPPKKRVTSTPPPKQEQSSKKDYAEELDVEKKFDPHLGAVVEVAEKVHKRYPSCDGTTRVAKCVYCEKVKDKGNMRCLGQNHHEKGSLRYVWACKTCFAGSPSWLEHYKHKSTLGSLWNYDLKKDKPIRHAEEIEKAVGRQIVQKRSDQINDSIAKALSKRLAKEPKPNNPLVAETIAALKRGEAKRAKENKKRFVEEFAKKKKDVVEALKKGAEKHGAKSVRVEVKHERRSVVAAREGARGNGEEMRSVPRWKRKGRSAKVRGRG